MTKEQLKIAGAIMVLIMTISVASIGTDILYHPLKHQASKPAFLPDMQQSQNAQTPLAQKKPTAEDDEKTLPARLKNASITHGEKISRKCKACHALKKDGAIKIGPPLWSIVGSPVASFFGFNYSDALKKRNTIWSPAELDRFLKKPSQYIPGTKMSFAGLDDGKDRADVISYLRTLTSGGKGDK